MDVLGSRGGLSNLVVSCIRNTIEMQSLSYFTLGEKMELVKETVRNILSTHDKCIQYDDALEIVWNDFDHDCGFTAEQQSEIMELISATYGISIDNTDRCRNFDHMCYREAAPGQEDEVVFRFNWESLFSCLPVHVNIEFLMKHFGEVYNNSPIRALVEKMMRDNNHIRYYTDILAGGV